MKNNRGWSLPEVLIVITISAVAGSLLISILFSSNQLFFDQSTQISHGLSLNQANKEISDLIRSSLSVVSQYPASGSPQYTSDSDTLVLRLPAVDSGSNVIDSVYDYAVIEKDSGNINILRAMVFPDPQSTRRAKNKVLTTSHDHMEFNYLDSSNHAVSPGAAVRVYYIINLSTNSGFSANESSVSATINLKNL